MSEIIIGSARHDENGKYSGGKAGDQTKTEVSTQTYYNHNKGWYVYRANSETVRTKLSEAMLRACNNENIGYSQSDRYSLEKYGTATEVACNTDCSELVRVCVKEATGADIGVVTTATIGAKLEKTKLFTKLGKIGVQLSKDKLFTGDILCTCTKGHVVIVVQGADDGRETIVPDGKPNLKVGSRGEEVKKLQQALNCCNNAGLVVDGSYGNLTRSAVIAFQKNHGLTPDGVYGPATAAKLKEIMNV